MPQTLLWDLIHALPGHLATARQLVIIALSPEQLDAFAEIAAAIRGRLDPDLSCETTEPDAVEVAVTPH